MTRQHKTPRQRAEETLATAQRVRDRIARQMLRTQKQLDALVHDLDEADDRLAYAKQDPALKGSTTTSTTNQSGATA